jgi:hypothetical protein
MGRMKLILICLLAYPAAAWAEPSRDQAVLNAILRVESRYLDEDRRDPNIAWNKNEQANTIRKAKYLDKLLALESLSKESVLSAYRLARERVKQTTDAKKPVRDADKAQVEAFRDLLRELRLAPPAI